MEHLDLDKSNLKRFGITMGVVFLVASGIFFSRHKSGLSTWLCLLSSIFLLFSLVKPTLLKPIYILWIQSAFILGWLNTRLLLIVIFYLIFAPIGIIMRLLKVDLLNRRIDRYKKSYWEEKVRMDFKPLDYERQF
ncbi:MAG: SxtJ family membrane protein [Candidatus Omnitrophica bacterium]|nr:SxtJ family membrane protein [Candidatus Omnitrophota bacterium]